MFCFNILLACGKVIVIQCDVIQIGSFQLSDELFKNGHGKRSFLCTELFTSKAIIWRNLSWTVH